nr:flagellar basal body-associated protein FliL [Texcoconibacillus texcoconensis]
MFIILIALALIGVMTLVLYTQFFQASPSDDGEPTIDEILDVSLETEEITTNLATNEILRARFMIQLDSDDARDELEKRDFQMENIIISELSDMRGSEIRGSEGVKNLEDRLRDEISKILQEGQVVDVYMHERVVQ